MSIIFLNGCIDNSHIDNIDIKKAVQFCGNIDNIDYISKVDNLVICTNNEYGFFTKIVLND